MNVNPLATKIAVPYARALFDFSINKNIMHQITADFQNLETFLTENKLLLLLSLNHLYFESYLN